MIGEFKSACRIELERLKNKRLPWWQNEIPMYFSVSSIMALGLHVAFGRVALNFLTRPFGQSFCLSR